MEVRWIQRQVPESAVRELISTLQVREVVARLLVERGIRTFDEARDFFNPDLSQLHDPFGMRDMDKAVDRLRRAIHSRERILVYGDYDVDGTTAVALVYSFLRHLGVDCDYYIPDRYTEGYGFSMRGVEWAAENGFGLIITLDCGIKDGARIIRATELGMDVIVCDHHNPEVLPPAFAVLDPKRPDCPYPFKGLSGCGVGFKLLQAFCEDQGMETDWLFQQLDLLTISIGADIVPLIGENRVLAHFGLQLLQSTNRPGIKAMLMQAAFDKPVMTISDVVFIIAPRINAAGRIVSGRQAVKLLLAEQEEEAVEFSTSIEANNKTRKELDKGITTEALELVASDRFYENSFSTVVHSEGWSKGVVGIVASRLVEAFYKPAIVLSLTDNKLAGSARSIPGVDLYEILGRCGDLVEQYGGHTMAAGLSLKPENFEAFRKRFDDEVAAWLGHQRPIPTEIYDAELDFRDIRPRFFATLERFAPFGPENMKPVFLARRVKNAKYTRTVGDGGAHLKLHVSQEGDTISMDGIGFDLGHWSATICAGEPVDILYTLEENFWNNRSSIQLRVIDIRRSEDAESDEQLTTTRSGKDGE